MKLKKLLCVVLSFAMLFSTMGLMAFAEGNAEASIGKNNYTTLKEAIEEANDKDTITLLSNISVGADDKSSLAGKYATIFLVEGKTVTVDLNGKTIHCSAEGLDTMLVGLFSTNNGGKLILTDSSPEKTGTVKVDSGDANVYGLLVNYTADCEMIIEDGNYILDAASDSLIYSGGNEGVTVNGGNFYLGNVGTGSNGSPWIFNAKGQNAAHVTVNGGTYNTDVNHQHYPFEVSVKNGLALKNNGDGTWTVVYALYNVNEQEWSSKWYNRNVGYATYEEAEAAANANVIKIENHLHGSECEIVPEVFSLAATINGVGYSSFTEAIAAAGEGDTVLLLTDVTTDTTTKLNRSITLDLGGNTFTPQGVSEGDGWNVEISNAANITLTNGTVSLDEITSGWHGIFGIGEGSLTMDETVLINGFGMTGNVFALTNGASVLTFDGTTVNIRNQGGGNGTYFIKSEPDSGIPKIAIKNNASITITNGQGGMNNSLAEISNSTMVMTGMAQHSFRNIAGTIRDSQITVETLEDGIKNTDGQVLEIKGDSTILLDAATPYNISGENTTLTIYGGSFSADPSDYLAEGMEILADSATGLFGVVPARTLTFETNEGDAMAPHSVANGTVIDLSEFIPTRRGYTFRGWFADAGLETLITDITLTADTTIYAKWAKKNASTSTAGSTLAARYTLSFDADGGNAIKSVSMQQNTVVDLSEYSTSKEGYRFDGWYADSELTEAVTTLTLTAHTTVYAKWVEETETQNPSVSARPAILRDDHVAYLLGREDGCVHPEANITRAEAATIFFRLLREDVQNKALTKENAFMDVNNEDWFCTAVSTLTSLEIITGRTADTFAPYDAITRAELTAIVARLSEGMHAGIGLFSDVSGHWAESYINEVAEAEWIIGYNGLFRPDDNITRAEVMTLVNRVLHREPESKADLLDGMTTWKDNANENAWYYLAVQEATNSHTCEMKADGKHEKWTSLTENLDWKSVKAN